MILRTAPVPVLAFAFVVLGHAAPSSVQTPWGAACAETADGIFRETQDFHTQAQQQGIDFWHSDVISPAINDIKERFKVVPNSPGMDAYKETKARADKFMDFLEKIKRTKEKLEILKECFHGASSPDCNLDQWWKTVGGDGTRQWVQAFGEMGTSAAARRVDGASGVYSGYVNKLEGSLERHTTSALQNCMNQYRDHAQAAEHDPVDLRPADQKSSSGGGMSTGTRVALGTLVTAGVAGGAILAAQNGSSGTGDNGGGSASIVINSVIQTFICGAPNGITGLRNCTGALSITIPNSLFAAGTGVTGRSNPSGFVGHVTAPFASTTRMDMTVSTTCPPGQVSVDFFGSGSSTVSQTVPFSFSASCQ